MFIALHAHDEHHRVLLGPFALPDLVGEMHPPGDYNIAQDEGSIEGLSWLAASQPTSICRRLLNGTLAEDRPDRADGAR